MKQVKLFQVSVSFIFIFLISFASLCCRKQQSDDEGSLPDAKATVAVKVGMVREQDALVSVEALGKTDALRKEKMYAPIAGRIMTLKALEGMEVKKGDVLAIIQTKESEATILGAESMLKSATTEQQKNEAEQVLNLARSTQNSVHVCARFDGIVSSRVVSEGELVAENAELLTIIDLSTVDFLADVALRDVPSLQRGQHAVVQFQSFPQKQFSARVDAVNPQTDIQSQSVKVRLQFLPSGNGFPLPLRTDMTGAVQITTGIRRHATFIPKSALLRNDENNSYSVVLMTADSLARIIPVSIGVEMDSSVEVRSENLRAGMAVVTEGNYALSDSTHLVPAQ